MKQCWRIWILLGRLKWRVVAWISMGWLEAGYFRPVVLSASHVFGFVWICCACLVLLSCSCNTCAPFIATVVTHCMHGWTPRLWMSWANSATIKVLPLHFIFVVASVVHACHAPLLVFSSCQCFSCSLWPWVNPYCMAVAAADAVLRVCIIHIWQSLL